VPHLQPAGGNYHQSYYAPSSHTTLQEEATSILTQGDEHFMGIFVTDVNVLIITGELEGGKE
jgi:hypothetical protein